MISEGGGNKTGKLQDSVRLAPAVVMFGAALYLLLVDCSACHGTWPGTGPIAKILPGLGVGVAGLFAVEKLQARKAKSSKGLILLNSALRETMLLALPLFLLAMLLGLARTCIPCLTFWAGFLANYVLHSTGNQSPVLGGRAFALLATTVVIVWAVPATNLSLKASLINFGVGQEAIKRKSLIGSALPGNLGAPADTAIILVPDCVPCAKAIVPQALSTLDRLNIPVRVWTHSADPFIKKVAAGKSVEVVGESVFGTLGVGKDDPPSILIVVGGMVFADIQASQLGEIPAYRRFFDVEK